MTIFQHLSQLPEDRIFDLNRQFVEDKRTNKVNLGVGIYRTDEAKPYVFPSVKKAESIIYKQGRDKEYLPIDGFPPFIDENLRLIFGKNAPKLTSGEICGVQTLGGSGALHLGGELLKQEISSRIFLPDPTWQNHDNIFASCRLICETYSYYNATTHDIDVPKFCDAICKMQPNDIILLHASCHNPAATDPTQADWKKLSALIKEHRVIPFFDLAYQGFDRGLEEDAWAVRYFVDQGHEILVANSYSKNVGLYGERIGSLSVVVNNKDVIPIIKSHLKMLIRSHYSNPPTHGALIIATIMQSDSLRNEWENELKAMRERIQKMRQSLLEGLASTKTPKDFSYLSKQRGIFSFLDLSTDQITRLREEKGIYMLDNGRINVAGLNPHNIDYVIKSLNSLLQQV